MANYDNWNYMALFVAILCGVLPEEAFYRLETGRVKRYKGQRTICRNLSDAEIKDMIHLRQFYTSFEVGQMFGMSSDAIRRRISRYNQKASC